MTGDSLLELLADAADVSEDGQFYWFGEPCVGSTNGLGVMALVDLTFEQFLYENFYCPGSPKPRTGVHGGLGLEDARLVHRRSIRDEEVYAWQPNWVVTDVCGERVRASRDGVRVWFHNRQVRIDPGAGGACQVWLPVCRPNLSPGFRSYTCGAAWDLREEVRVYWSLTAQVVPDFVELALQTLAQQDLAINFKVAARADMFWRADAAVMYMSRSTYDRATPHLERLYSRVESGLKPTSPALTYESAAGVGVAESPHDGSSFGQFVCSTLLHGIASIASNCPTSRNSRTTMFRESIKAVGLNPEKPHAWSTERNNGYSRWRVIADQ